VAAHAKLECAWWSLSHLQQTHLLHGDVATSTIRVRVTDTGGEEQREEDTVVRHLVHSPRGGYLLVPPRTRGKSLLSSPGRLAAGESVRS